MSHGLATRAMFKRIRTFDWSSTRLGAMQDWSEGRRTLVDLMLASRDPMFLVAETDLRILFNDAFLALNPDRFESALGAPFDTIFPDMSARLPPLSAAPAKTPWNARTTIDVSGVDGSYHRFSLTRLAGESSRTGTVVAMEVEQGLPSQAERQRILRNLLSRVRSIVQRSAVNNDTIDDFSMHVEGRLGSLGRAYLMLDRARGRGVQLEDILREELLTHPMSDERVSIDGPAVALGGNAAEAMALVIHELATNAFKFGALTAKAGLIRVAWSVDARSDGQWLHFEWREAGTQIASPAPRKEGFGCEMVTRLIPYELGGSSSFVLRPGGLEVIISFPLPGFVQSR